MDEKNFVNFMKRTEEDYALDLEYALASGDHQEREAMENAITEMDKTR